MTLFAISSAPAALVVRGCACHFVGRLQLWVSSHQSLCRWCGLVPISEDLELVLELHGRSEKETAGKRIRESVTKLG
jgi:hypothetical protein